MNYDTTNNSETTTETKDCVNLSVKQRRSKGQRHTKVKSALLLNVVVRKSTSILKLLAGKNQTLLVGGDAFLVLDFSLHVIDRVGRLDFQRDGFTSQGLHKDLHTTTETENKVKGRLFLNIVV